MTITSKQKELLQRLLNAGGEMQARPLSGAERSNLSRMQIRGLVRWKSSKLSGKNLDDWIISITDKGRSTLS